MSVAVSFLVAVFLFLVETTDDSRMSREIILQLEGRRNRRIPVQVINGPYTGRRGFISSGPWFSIEYGGDYVTVETRESTNDNPELIAVLLRDLVPDQATEQQP